MAWNQVRRWNLTKVMKVNIHFLAVISLLFVVSVASSQVRRKSTPPPQMTVSGTRADTLKGAPVTLLTVNGSQRLSKTNVKRSSVYHALIFHPDSRVLSLGGGFSNDGQLSTVTISWTIQKTPNDFRNTEEKELKITNHVVNQMITVGPDEFSLTKGNLFIIRLNENWLPASTQIIQQLTESVDRKTVLDTFKTSTPDDEVIQKLQFESNEGGF